MLRRLFTLLSGLSFLLCIAPAAMWIRSYRHHQRLWIGDRFTAIFRTRVTPDLSRSRFSYLEWVGGRLDFYYCRQLLPADTRPQPQLEFSVSSRDPKKYAAFPGSSWWNRRGFGCIMQAAPTLRNPETELFVVLAVPLWLPVLLFAVPPLLYLRRIMRRRRRLRVGLCPTCGYDLRATPTQCPECGTPAPAKDKQQITIATISEPTDQPISRRNDHLTPPPSHPHN